MQRGRQINFKKRAIYYASLLAVEQAPKGNRAGWAYNLPEIYLVGLLEDFSVEVVNDSIYKRDICLMNRETGTVFYEGLGYVFLELVNFVKTEDELAGDLDKWLYVLKHMSRMDKLPVFMRKTIFEKVFSIAEYSNMTKEEKTMYNTALKRKWDNQNVLDYAVQTAVQTAREEERAKAEAEKAELVAKAEKAEVEKQEVIARAKAEKKQIVLAFKQLGMPVKDIAKAVGLPIDEIEKI